MSSDNDLTSSINFVTMQVNRHAAAFMLLFGTVGNLLNVCVLSEHSLHKIPCSIYLYWSSVSSLLFLWSALLTRVLQGYNVNWPNQNDPVCKIRLYLLSVSWATTIWFLVGASIDRFLCSSISAKYRQLSTVRNARRFNTGILIFFGILFVETIYCFEASVPNVPVACYGRNLPCRMFNDWVSLAVDIILPSILLLTFGLLTIRNAQSRIIQPTTNSTIPNNNTLPTRRNDRNLTRMLLIQVSMVLVLDFPFGIYRPYASITANVPKSSYRVAIENLIYALVILFVFFTHSISFFLYTLTGSLFRAAFKRIRQRIFNRIQRTN